MFILTNTHSSTAHRALDVERRASRQFLTASLSEVALNLIDFAIPTPYICRINVNAMPWLAKRVTRPSLPFNSLVQSLRTIGISDTLGVITSRCRTPPREHILSSSPDRPHGDLEQARPNAHSGNAHICQLLGSLDAGICGE